MEEYDELETESGGFEDAQVDSTSSPLERKREERLKLEVPSLTVKERKELASYAHSLGKKLKTQLVGKSGVTPNVATSFIETLEANELLKVSINFLIYGSNVYYLYLFIFGLLCGLINFTNTCVCFNARVLYFAMLPIHKIYFFFICLFNWLTTSNGSCFLVTVTLHGSNCVLH